MRRNLTNLVIAILAGLSACSLGQGGFGGGGGGVMQQGSDQRTLDSSVQQIEQRIGIYLGGDEIKNVLTPGEFSEWKLDLKAGQVVIAEARSDAFDPAIQVVGPDDKVLAFNDDRYPGDQRPLLLWRCEKEGAYSLRIRCFHDKSGGQFFTRFRTYDTVDLTSNTMVERTFEGNGPFLLRVPMKAGQIKEIVAEVGGKQGYASFRFLSVIFPGGLPERAPSLAEPIAPAIRALIAPVDGDYYLLESLTWREGGSKKIKVGTREVIPAKLTKEGTQLIGNAQTNTSTMWQLPVKTGDLLEASTSELWPDCKLILSEVPDFSKFDVSKPESNPFFPHEKPLGVNPDQAIDVLPARARDRRVTVFRVRRDTTLWVTSDGVGPEKKTFALRVKPAAFDFPDGRVNTGKLRIGNTDYWAIDGKAGDVMTLNTNAAGFAQEISVRDPDLQEIRGTTAGPDQVSESWRMIVQKPGRYLVAISCFGDGGGGDYSLSRQVYHATEFNGSTPAKSEISNGQIQIWKFTAQPNAPLFVRWNSSKWSYDISIYDEKGQDANFQREAIDDKNAVGILKVSEPRTYVIVLTGTGDKANYSIELGPIPGYKPVEKKTKP